MWNHMTLILADDINNELRAVFTMFVSGEKKREEHALRGISKFTSFPSLTASHDHTVFKVF